MTGRTSPRWCDHFRTPTWNRLLAETIDSPGSPGHTSLEQVNRLDWPLVEQVLHDGPDMLRPRFRVVTEAPISRQA